jgi:sigma-B regulation protein RsbU (phosphoserine phosphatase)
MPEGTGSDRGTNGERESGLALEYKTLIEAVKTIVATLDLDTVLERLLYLTHKILGFEYCTIFLIADDAKTLEAAARYGYPESIVQKVDLAVGRGVTGMVAETGEPHIVPDVTKEEAYLPGLMGAKSELVVPLVFRGRVIGVFDVQSPELNSFSKRDMDFLAVLAGTASVAIINAKNHAAAIRNRDEAERRRALEGQISLARTFQEYLLPRKDPDVPGFDVAGMNLPGETLSGDYFDYIELPRGHLGVAVADVSGKGVPAALLAASIQGTLRSHIENLYSISTIMERVNDSLYRSIAPENFATLFYGVLDPGGSLTYVNAGHNPPVVLRTDGDVTRLTEGGTVLGMFPGRKYAQGRIDLRPGDYFVAYTDGLADSSQGDEQFGEKRIIETLSRVRGAPARIVASVLITEADSFSGPGAPPDDMTVVVARRLGYELPEGFSGHE